MSKARPIIVSTETHEQRAAREWDEMSDAGRALHASRDTYVAGRVANAQARGLEGAEKPVVVEAKPVE